MIVFTGKAPEGLVNFQAMCIRYTMRYYAYMLLLVDRYPSFEEPGPRRRRRRRSLPSDVRGDAETVAVVGGGSGAPPSPTCSRAAAPTCAWPSGTPTWPRATAAARENARYLPGVALEDGVDPVALGPRRSRAPDRGRRGAVAALRRRARRLRGRPRARGGAGLAGQGPRPRDRLAPVRVLAARVDGDPERVAALSGPNHAEEIARGTPAAPVVAAESAELCRRLQAAFSTSRFRVYANADLVGVELCAAAKNVIAIAAGASDGLGYGDNAKAALMTRGLAEMSRLGAAFGADPRTFAGLAGLGDLVATCCSDHSRNRRAGILLARGVSPDDLEARIGMVAEGVVTAPDAAPHRPRARARPAPDGARVRRARGLESTAEAVEFLLARAAGDEF